MPRATAKAPRPQVRMADPSTLTPEQLEQALWAPQPGPQTEVLCRQEDEILIGGQKGGGKSFAGIGYLISGNYYKPANPSPIDISYVNSGHYRALSLRRNIIDLHSWINEARRVYEPMGAELTHSPLEFKFPSGARITMGHLSDTDAAYKYFGNVVHRVFVDELTFIPTLQLYLQLFSCVRSTVPGIRPQLLLTANPGGPGHCVPYGDVLTPNGWRDIKDMRVGDAVFTVDAEGFLKQTVVAQVHSSHYDGDIITASARGLHICCTPNHKVAKLLGTKGREANFLGIKKPFSLVPFDKLPGQATIIRTVKWDGVRLGTVSIPELKTRRVKHIQPLELDGTTFCSLLGWFLSEGFTIAGAKFFGISQHKADGIAKINKLLNLCGFKYKWNSGSAIVYSPSWWAYFRQFGKSYQKFIPENVKNATKPELMALLESLMDGDGCWLTGKTSGTYFTCSERLAGGVCEILLKLGFVVLSNSRLRAPTSICGNPAKSQRRKAYEISFKTVKSGGTELLTGNHLYSVPTQTKRRSDITRVAYSGPVYCIGVEDTHTFIIRQNACVWVSGNSWVKDRFISPVDDQGNIIPPRTTIREESFNPFLKRKVAITRVFIPAKIDDNKKLTDADPLYYSRLMTLPEAEREAYLFGNWDAFQGIYFGAFRPIRRLGEPENALHVVPRGTRPLAPWWNRWIGGDWGYRHASAIFWACQDPNGQVTIYDEMISPGVSAIELGAQIAIRSLPALEGLEDHTMTLYFSPDAFSVKDDVNTQAEQMIAGMRRVLGPECAYIASDDEIPGGERAMTRIQSQRRGTIVLRQAQNARVSGWQYMREMLRWKPLPQPDKNAFDRSYAAALYRNDLGKYKEYCAAFNEKSELFLPKLLFTDNCVHARKAIPTASYKPDTEDVLKTDSIEDDVLDGLRYTIAAHQAQKLKEPFGVYYGRRMDEITAAHPEGMDGQMKVQIARRLESEYQEQSPNVDGFTARSSSRLGRMREFVQ